MKKIWVLSLFFIYACGMQLLDPNARNNILPNVPGDGTGSDFTIGGVVEGLPDGLDLELTVNNLPFTVDQSGPFTAPYTFDDLTPFEVVIVQTPLNYVCNLTNATGVIEGQNIDNVLIVCEVDPSCLGQGTISGKKYYDANANGVWDPEEVGIANWPIHYAGASTNAVFTNPQGSFTLTLDSGSYVVSEGFAQDPWFVSGNLVNQTTATPQSSATLLMDQSYAIELAVCGQVTHVNFGNVCLGMGGGKTLGFWSNPNGENYFGNDDLDLVVGLNLRDAAGNMFTATNYTNFRNWLLGASATNMAYQLSAQMAASALNQFNNFLIPNAMVYAPQALGANNLGFISLADLINEANDSLGVHGFTPIGHPERAYQEGLKNALDQANNDQGYVQPTPSFCPVPLFP